MLAKEAVAHIVSFLPESMSFEEIIQALTFIYSDRYGLDERIESNTMQAEAAVHSSATIV